ncbi:MAG: HlyD family type I secretion periplasmic adaptor subunit [Azospirillum sp.]|nr:HlyD family type I secretion periplasmic adaptor subunit [Azospirillum sp.]
MEAASPGPDLGSEGPEGGPAPSSHPAKPSPPLPPEARAYQPDALALETRPLPFPARLVLYAVCAFLLLALVWAWRSEVDRIVIAKGKLMTTAQPVIVQPLETSIIRSLDVDVGDFVKADQTVATLDPTFAAADLAELDGRIASFRAQIDRLRAEINGRPVPDSSVGAAAPAAQIQARLYVQRQQEYRTRVEAFDEHAARLQSGLATNAAAQKESVERQNLADQIVAMRSQAAAKEVGSRLNLLQAQQDRASIHSDLENLRNRKFELEHELKEVLSDRAAYQSEWRRKLSEELAEVSRQHDSLVEQKAKAARRKTLVRLSTPVDAIVLEIAKRSVGSVVKDSEPLVTLVPTDSLNELEAEISANDIGFVRAGDPARVKIEAFPFQRHGTLEGQVRTISADAFQHDANAPGATPGAYFRTRITLKTTKLLHLPEGTILTPGMQATAEIKVGHRTVLSYLLYPVIRALDESIREP